MRGNDAVICNLHDLPAEVLSEIALYLDFEDILSLQQTSKKLQEATETHTVWLTLAQEYSRQHFHLHRPESGALNDLNTSDLRDWIRRRLTVDHIWRKARSVQPRVRTLPNQRLVVHRLVPGGRWLLVGHLRGHLCYYDLDSEDLKCVHLIQPSEDVDGSHQDIYGLEIDVDQDAPVLGFNIVMCGIDDESLAKTQWLHVWQAKLKDGDSLTAERLTSVPAYFSDAGFGIISLKGHLLARAVITRVNLTWIEIYWWKQCSSTSVLRTAFPVAYIPDNVYVVGDDKILCTKPPATVELYNLLRPGREHIGDAPIRASWAPPRDPMWSHTFSSDGRMDCSPLYCDGAVHRLVVSTNQGIWGLVFPATKGDTPSITQLSTFSNRRTICVPGIRKACTFYGEDITCIRIRYSWDDGGGGILPMRYVNGVPKASLFPGRQPAFDEENGRFVWRTMDAEADIVIADFLHEVSGDPATRKGME